MQSFRCILFCCLAASILLFSCKEKQEKKPADVEVVVPPPVIEGIPHALIRPPVQILPSTADSTKFKAILRTAENDIQLEADGRIAQLDFDFENSLVIDGRQFGFRHLHFHSPGLHLLEGISFPMEFHVITQPTDENSSEEYLVIATLFKIGEENPFIREILNQSAEPGMSGPETLLGILKGGQAMVNKTNLDMGGFYHYTGFLASKPYSESVDWYITRKIFEVSAEQIEQIKTLQEQE